MKKEKLITRTIISTKVDAKFFNLADEVVFNSEVTFTGKLDEKRQCDIKTVGVDIFRQLFHAV